MVALSDCYFCGTVADDLEQYSVLPAEMDPPEERQRRVVVCLTCREKLDRVIESVVAFATEAEVPEAGASEAGTSEGDTSDGKSGAEADRGAGDETGEERDGGATEVVSEEEPTEEEGDEPASSEGSDDPAPTEGSDDPVPSELPPEANKVLRLLGNRSFPVDRGETVAVATNAYDLERAQVEAVLATLVDRGQLREENGTLYRAE